MRAPLSRVALLLPALALLAPATAAAELLYVTEGNRLWRVDLAAEGDGGPRRSVLIERASGDQGNADAAPDFPPEWRRDINGMVCALPGGGGRLLAGEDTGQPEQIPGWGIFSPDGRQEGKLVPTYRVPQGEPHGCAVDADGRLFTTSVGNRGFLTSLGQLIQWFPPYEGRPGRFCKLATDIGTAGAVAVDAQGRVYVASNSRGAIYRFLPPFPTGPDAAGGCGAVDEVGSQKATNVRSEVFTRGLYTFSGLAFAPNGNLYASSVFTGEIVEIGPDGAVVRTVLDPPEWIPPFATGTPFGLAVDAEGTLYYADLDLQWDLPSIGPGPNGKVWRIRFDAAGEPQPPEVLLDGLAFPDGVTVLPGRL